MLDTHDWLTEIQEDSQMCNLQALKIEWIVFWKK